ncbi:MAG: PEP-CTERM sorting domain-containing protein [Planctomycetota bacterium]
MLKDRMAQTIVAVALLAFPVSALAAPIWPSYDGWHPVTVSGGYYIDPLYEGAGTDRYATPPNPNELDLMGGTDLLGNGEFATGFWYSDGSNIMFRMRVNGDPAQGTHGSQHVWMVFLNTDTDDDVDWSLQLDNKVDQQVELVQAISGGPSQGNPWDPVILADPPHTGVAPLSTWSQFVNASLLPLDPPYGGSYFEDQSQEDYDYFVDVAFPLVDFFNVTGLTTIDGIGVAFATSSDHSNINKDLPDYDGWSDDIPEPATVSLLALGALAVFGRRLRLKSRR